MSGMMGDAEQIKFVDKQDTIEKIKGRIEMLEGAKGLPGETKLELLKTLYGLSNDEIVREVEGYIEENFPHATERTFRDKFQVYWLAVITREKRDLHIALAKLEAFR
jgi:hypothetical protein